MLYKILMIRILNKIPNVTIGHHLLCTLDFFLDERDRHMSRTVMADSQKLLSSYFLGNCR